MIIFLQIGQFKILQNHKKNPYFAVYKITSWKRGLSVTTQNLKHCWGKK